MQLTFPPSRSGRRLRRFGRKLRRCESGLALTEFAFAIPILLTLGLVGMEVAWLTLAHLKVSNIAMMTADNASRVRDSIDEGNVTELFLGASMAGASMNFSSRGRIILYSIEPNAANTRQWIRWQRCTGSKAVAPSYGRPRTAGGTNIVNGTEIYNTDRQTASNNPSSETGATATAIGPAANQIAAASGTAVNLAEVHYDYQPLLAGNVLGNITISRVAAFNVRQRTNQSITNGARITPASCG
ncbi:MAG TPA: pilus assembly protein [Allosphingosinicella sp.]